MLFIKIITVLAAGCPTSCGFGSPTVDVYTCCPGYSPPSIYCVAFADGYKSGSCEAGSCSVSCTEQTQVFPGVCPDGNNLTVNYTVKKTGEGDSSECLPFGKKCCCKQYFAGQICPAPPPPPCDDCNIQAVTAGGQACGNPANPAQFTTGQNFNINFQFKATHNYEVRTILRNGTRIWCEHNEDLGPACATLNQSPAVSVTCPAAPGLYTYRIGCHDFNIVDPNNCDFLPSGNESSDCFVNCAAPAVPSVGSVRVMGPNGVIELNLISVADALAKVPFPGMVKVMMPSGPAAADLVATTDSNASPVRLRTPVGVYSWAEL